MKPGDKVIMNDTYYVSEASKGKIWIVRTYPFYYCGTMTVRLEDETGGYALYAMDGLDLIEDTHG